MAGIQPLPSEHVEHWSEEDWFNQTLAITKPEVAPAKPQSELQGKLDAAMERLATELSQGHTEGYREVLAFYGQFWSYSLGNSILIMLQKPEAQVVAGFAKWKKLGRQVRQGATAAKIFCPMFRKETDPETGGIVQVISGFTEGRVFSDADLVDSDTNPIPTMWKPLPDTAQALYEQLAAKVEALGYTIAYYTSLPGGSQGMANDSTKEIALLKYLDSQNRTLVLLHELSHQLFHHKNRGELSKQQREFEAESVAMIVAAILGITSPTARDYLLNWGASAEELKASFVHIQTLARDMIGKLELTAIGRST